MKTDPKKLARQKAINKLFEETELIDQAADQYAAPEAGTAAPLEPAGTQPMAAPQAAPNIQNPLVPPQPGMIPIGWMWPQQSGMATAMQTGDVNMAAQAPDAAPIEPAEPGAGAPEGDDMNLTDEEKDLVLTEYAAWKARKMKIAETKKALNKKMKEQEMEDPVAPTMPEEVELVEPPTDDDSDVDSEDLDSEMGEEVVDEEDSVVDKVEDIVIDIASVFADLGGDVDEALASINPEEDDDLDMEDEDVDMDDMVSDEDVPDEGDVDEEAAVFEEKRRAVAARIKEFRARKKEAAAKPIGKQIKYPAGSEPNALTQVEERIARRREAIAALRAKRALKEEGIADDADPDKIDKEIGFESVNATIDKLGESQIKKASQKPLDRKFVERYQEKKALNFKELLSKGLLG